MRALAESIAAGFGAKAEFDFRALFPPLVNHADETAFIADCAAEVVGDENVNRNGPLTMASEDFSYMLEKSRAPTSRSATATAKAPAKCTTPATTSTTPPCPSAAPFSVTWSKSTWKGSGATDPVGSAEHREAHHKNALMQRTRRVARRTRGRLRVARSAVQFHKEAVRV